MDSSAARPSEGLINNIQHYLSSSEKLSINHEMIHERQAYNLLLLRYCITVESVVVWDAYLKAKYNQMINQPQVIWKICKQSVNKQGMLHISVTETR